MVKELHVVVIAAAICRIDNPRPDKIRVRSAYVDPTVVETLDILHRQRATSNPYQIPLHQKRLIVDLKRGCISDLCTDSHSTGSYTNTLISSITAVSESNTFTQIFKDFPLFCWALHSSTHQPNMQS